MNGIKRIGLGVLAGLSLGAAPLAGAAEHYMLVLDASGSMLGQVGGKPKVQIAREAVAELLRGWPAGDQLGLVAYGHRRKGDCKDIETLLPVAPLDAAAYAKAVNAVAPKGMTPLSDAVVLAAEALRYKERKATVILVSDGEETCQRDPCAVGRDLKKASPQFTVHVIGFDVADPRHQEQLKCLVRNTGGRYFNARNAGELSGALGAALKAGGEPRLPPAPASVTPPAEATVASVLNVPWQGPVSEGDYVDIARPGAEPLSSLTYDDRLEKGKPARLELPAEPGEYQIRYLSPRRDKPVLASAPIVLKVTAASVFAPARVMASDLLDVQASGPVSERHWVGIAPKGAPTNTFTDYAQVDASGKTRARLRAPQVPGEYEVRYVLNENESIVARRPLTVLPAVARFNNPVTELRINEAQTVYFEGPRAQDNWIGYVPRGAGPERYETFMHMTPSGNLQLIAPEASGDYDLVYVINGEKGEQIIARQPVRVR